MAFGGVSTIGSLAAYAAWSIDCNDFTLVSYLTLAQLILELTFLTKGQFGGLQKLVRPTQRPKASEIIALCICAGLKHLAVLGSYWSSSHSPSSSLAFFAVCSAHFIIVSTASLMQRLTEGPFSLIEQLPQPIMIYNEDLGLVKANLSATTLFEKFELRELSTALRLDSPRTLIDHLYTLSYDRNLRQLGPVTATMGIKTLSLTASKAMVDGHRLVVLTVEDCSEKVRLAKRKEMESTQDLLMRVVSHNLKTPLNSIYGFLSQVVVAPALNQQVHKFIEFSLANCRLLSCYIDNIIDLSHFTVGTFALNPTLFSIRDLANSCIEPFKLQTDSLGVQLECIINDVPDQIYHCKARLHQILTNLISNAVTATSTGKISVKISQAQRGNLKIIITDSGHGIPYEQQEEIKQHFYSNSVELPGGVLKLGLHITNLLAIQLGGEPLRLVSVPEDGSLFWFILKLNQFDKELSQPWRQTTSLMPPSDLLPTVLIVDDSAFNRLVTVSLLESKGFKCAEANSGEVAIEMISRRQHSQFKLVLMDYEMPGMNGPTAVSKLMSCKRTGAIESLPVFVGHSSYSSANIREECLRVGMLDCLSKPCDISQLLAVVSSCHCPQELTRIVSDASEYQASPPPNQNR
jgi:signal transduction histidine kinase/DNA-binding NarL/FixJ family response regulator